MSEQSVQPTLNPWHPGEIRLQQSVGVADRMAVTGPRVIRNFMLDQHRDFYRQLPFLVLGSVDPDGGVWATIATGQPGFAHSPEPRLLQLTLRLSPDDPATAGLAASKSVGMLGIELHTRRRNRMNGRIAQSDESGFTIEVEQSYGNCPQYIQLRDFAFLDQHQPGPVERCAMLGDHARSIIEAADAFFVASYFDHPEKGRQIDASHRGGKAGFVRIGEDGLLTIPDFAGNLHFNTLGNFLLNPRAGLVFADWETGDLLQMTGTAEVILGSPEIAAFQGAERIWTFRPERIILRKAALPLRFVMRADGWSPNSLMTGDWAEARSRIEAQRFADAWRRYRIAEIIAESSVIRSFVLEPEDGGGLIPHAAGQHLPIRIRPDGADEPLIRTYTLSSAPSDKRYRISVRRQGLISKHLHDVLRVGDVIEARAPAGHFTLDALEHRPAVLLAAGVGVTPMLAMLRHIVYEGLRKRRIRPTWLFYAARSADERAFDAEITELVAKAGGKITLVRVLADPNAGAGSCDAHGRIDLDLIKSRLPFDDYDFYLCGPPAFMQSIYDGLRDLNIADGRLHAEAFGPASMKRRPDAPSSAPLRQAATTSVPVAFVASGKEARWTPAGGSLLELAEARGLSPAYSCRSGTCGTCKVKVVAGAVAYTTEPSAAVGADEALICCSVPAQDGGERLVLDV
ncbi:MAG: pyridoxamine 5'-phosphate oxidase family protein [Beijerinckiaceae bacterium]|nr:pyridoxamine 5'-phosphate oxidase family protein [Beijerinckiaceae bacterium]